MKNKKLVYISRNYKGVSAGNDARTDTEILLDKFGYKNIGLKRTFHQNKILDFTRNLFSTLKGIIFMPYDGVLFIQYPTKKYYTFLCRIAHFKHTKVISLIHDLGSFRRKKITEEKEIARLNHSDYIIATNEKMADWLKSKDIKAKISSLDIWHFLSDKEHSMQPITSGYTYSISYAGALNRRKNAFLYDFIPYARNFNFNIYGDTFDIPDTDNFHCKGYIASDTFIMTNKDDFGLVWDGDSMDECTGSFGEYLKYNTPHKVSFYIKSHLPIIIWKKAALASFIEEHKIGIAINSLKEINDIIASIKPEEYNAMKQNTAEVSKKLQSGYYLQRAIDNLHID
ncbi:galactofuranosyltransferase [Prevotella sp. 10(H)]|uniref:galactofuranosyltransferase n=1 Tax=Prevotella sp. 10(H) TaxID=1158294 RepID=UPI0004A72DFD|nr:galactofuranosyltransferase [Prevotella sp. 10(H)]